MTPSEAGKLEIGHNVQLVRNHVPVHKGRVTQATRTWFMVTWFDGTPEIIRRDRESILLSRLEQIT